MLTHGSKGPAVAQLQQQLIALNYPLPRYGADGDLGNETLNAVARFLTDHAGGYVDADPDSVSDEERALIQQVYDKTSWPIPVPGKPFYDLRRESDSRNIHGRRQWIDITGITFHQCAVDFGAEKPARWDTLSAHVGSNREGAVMWVHEFEHIVWHGNELNHATVGIEFEGLYAGILSQPGDRTEHPTPAMVESGKQTVRWIVATVAAHGGCVRNLYAHRQTAQSRRGDPGEEIWKLIAIPMIEELGLTDGGPAFKIDNGRVICNEWNPDYPGVY